MLELNDLTVMKAMLLRSLPRHTNCDKPLVLEEIPLPRPQKRELLIRVLVCGVCHTELDEIEGRLPPSKLPIVLGHQVIGIIEETGPECVMHAPGERVGVAWIQEACGNCEACKSGQENLCPFFKATGRDTDGGYAEYMIAKEDFAYPVPAALLETEAAPMLCAGAIGYRSLMLTGLHDGQVLGLTGFGASGHLVLKLAKLLYPNSPVYVFARNQSARSFALELGASWSGGTEETPPRLMDAVIDTTPAWHPVLEALRKLSPGGRLVINAIRKEGKDKTELSLLDYSTHLWLEKEIKSVANVTRSDVTDFLKIAAHSNIRPELQEYPLTSANEALQDLKSGKIIGAALLRVSQK